MSHFGPTLEVCATIYEDLQKTTINEARIDPKLNDNSIEHYLMALHSLKCYPTESQREAIFDISAKWGRNKCWFYIEKIRALQDEKIVFPDFGDEIWIMTVDGTHFWIQEPTHPIWSMDSAYFSHKFGKAGVNYELGISIATQQLI